MIKDDTAGNLPLDLPLLHLFTDGARAGPGGAGGCEAVSLVVAIGFDVGVQHRDQRRSFQMGQGGAQPHVPQRNPTVLTRPWARVALVSNGTPTAQCEEKSQAILGDSVSVRPPWNHGIRPIAILAATALALTACSSGDPSPEPDRTSSATSTVTDEKVDKDAHTATLAALTETVVLAGDSPAALAGQAAQTFFDSAPVVVVVTEAEALRGASAAATLGIPVVLDDDQLAGELERLGSEVALAIGLINDPGIDVVVPRDDEELAQMIGADAAGSPVADDGCISALLGLTPDSPQLLAAAPASPEPVETPMAPESATPEEGPAPAGSSAPAETQTALEPLEPDRDELPKISRPESLSGVTVMTTGADRDAIAVGTALASGAQVMLVAGGDPRASSESVKALGEAKPEVAVGVGPEFGDAETLTWRLASAATGTELPGGGQLVLPGKTYVALYGTPGAPVLGVLGEQEGEATIQRAAGLAKEYEPLTANIVVPALEIITTVAAAQAGSDGDYSNEIAIETLRPLIDLAAENGQYVVLDLQPGRTDFLTQAKLYEELLKLPHVGLALDPEWRLLPDQVHLRQIGHVEVAEVNSVISWLADLTRANSLPQKVPVLHQFQLQSLRDVGDVDQTRSEIAVLIHVDGLGAQPAKQDKWRTLLNNASSIEHWGWKNFYDVDIPGPLSPTDTMTKVDPVPDFVSYQ